MRLQFWFEFASTYSYPAVFRIERLASAAGAAVEWKPFLLGPIFQSQGWGDSPFNLFPALEWWKEHPTPARSP
jgi:2-hydroxychromene-2-carboxylate isomerase